MSNLVNPQTLGQNFGVEMSPDNTEIPRFYLMQGLSTPVSEGKAAVGEIRESSDNACFATTEEGMQVLPVCVLEFWQRFKIEGSDKKFFEEVKVTDQNKHWPYEQVDELGNKIKNDRVFKIYMIPLQDPSTPRLMTFGRSSRNAGKKLVTQMGIKNAAKGLSPWGMILSVNPKLESKQIGSKTVKFAAVDVVPVGPASKEQEQMAKKWALDILGKNQSPDALDEIEF